MSVMRSSSVSFFPFIARPFGPGCSTVFVVRDSRFAVIAARNVLVASYISSIVWAITSGTLPRVISSVGSSLSSVRCWFIGCIPWAVDDDVCSVVAVLAAAASGVVHCVAYTQAVVEWAHTRP
eukprot:GILK01019928.1.p1 GENE.GILK01019928.1~~GILK01019928.1.p1  ORF type:complete len:123 (-),score=16.84 GILK01019928.1:65-433(-)